MRSQYASNFRFDTFVHFTSAFGCMPCRRLISRIRSKISTRFSVGSQMVPSTITGSRSARRWQLSSQYKLMFCAMQTSLGSRRPYPVPPPLWIYGTIAQRFVPERVACLNQCSRRRRSAGLSCTCSRDGQLAIEADSPTELVRNRSVDSGAEDR